MSEMYSFTGICQRVILARLPDRLSHWHGVYFSAKVYPTGQQRYARGEAIVNYLARKEQQHTVDVGGKGKHGNWITRSRLGYIGKFGEGMGVTHCPFLSSAIRAPEIARNGVLFSLQRT